MGGNPSGENSVYIGSRPTMNYVMAVIMVLNKGKECIVKARGRAISHAVDVCEIVKNRFMKDANYRDIIIKTEQVKGKDGKESNVSAMEIKLSPFK